MNPIKPIKIKKNMKVSELVEGMGEMGFGAGKIAEASRIMRKMFDDKECKVFLGIAGAMVPAGMKNIILDLGGVILNIDYHRTVTEFEKLGAPGMEKVFSQEKYA